METLPKSLHTVRILVAVARSVTLPRLIAAKLARDSYLSAVRDAAVLLGYPDASASDPLIVKAAAQLAAGK